VLMKPRAHSSENPQPPKSDIQEIKPNVLIMIATDPIGGPGKGLFQFLQYAPRSAFDYILCNFNLKNRPVGQFIQEARRRHLNLQLLEQRAVIDPFLIFQAWRVIKQHGVTLIQTHGYKSNVIGCILRVCFGMPWIGFAHGYTNDNLKMRLYNRIDQLVLRFANRVITVSRSMKELLIHRGVPEERIRLVYNAVEPAATLPSKTSAEMKHQYGISAKKKIIGVIGRLSPEKGQLVFLRAMTKVLSVSTNVLGLIIGDGPDRASLEKYCEQNGLTDYIEFTGYQSCVSDYYQILDLLVLPSHSEGLPNAVLEAMSFGVPVLATAVGGLPEIIDEGIGNGVLVPPDDPDALAQRMGELLKDDSARRAIGLRGQLSLHPRFSPDHRAREIFGLYHELCTLGCNQPAHARHV